jgi:hypothetical protein
MSMGAAAEEFLKMDDGEAEPELALPRAC